MIDLSSNSTYSTVIQSLRDLRAASSSDPAVVAKIDELAAALTSDAVKIADDALSSRQYNDTHRGFIRLMVPDTVALVDILTPDALWLCVYLLRRIMAFTQYVSFRADDLARAVGWSSRKLRTVLAECKDTGALVVVDDSAARSPFGTVYMVSPALLDNSGKSSKSEFNTWRALMDARASSSNFIPEEENDDKLSRPMMWFLPFNGSRVRVACVCMHENENVISIPQDTDEDFDPAFSDIDEIVTYNELHVTC